MFATWMSEVVIRHTEWKLSMRHSDLGYAAPIMYSSELNTPPVVCHDIASMYSAVTDK